MNRYLVHFDTCREGQSHSTLLFATSNTRTACFWAGLPGFVVFDTHDNYRPVIN